MIRTLLSSESSSTFILFFRCELLAEHSILFTHKANAQSLILMVVTVRIASSITLNKNAFFFKTKLFTTIQNLTLEILNPMFRNCSTERDTRSRISIILITFM